MGFTGRSCRRTVPTNVLIAFRVNKAGNATTQWRIARDLSLTAEETVNWANLGLCDGRFARIRAWRDTFGPELGYMFAAAGWAYEDAKKAHHRPGIREELELAIALK